jgi:ABC-2 type transport system ATP-binding protein
VGAAAALSYDLRPMSLSVRNLSKRYGPLEAVSGVSFDVAAGEVFGLLGPNGAGKTTTIECLTGLVRPDAGHVEIGGVDVLRHPRRARARLGVALQSTGLQDKITAREALAAFGALYAKPAPAGELLERFGLAEKADARVETLSGGQRQRLALAIAFLNDPQVLVLDEPTAGLDVHSRRELHEHVRRMQADGRAVLIATHDMDEAEQLCSRLAVMDAGRIVARGAPRDLIAGVGGTSDVVARVDRTVPASVLSEVLGARDGRAEGQVLRFSSDHLGASLASLFTVLSSHGAAVVSLHAGRPRLEDVILHLTGRGAP